MEKDKYLVIEPGLGKSLFARKVDEKELKEIIPKTQNWIINDFIEISEVGQHIHILGEANQIVVVRIE